MKTLLTACAALLLTFSSWSQTYNSGDKDLDATLKSINVEANKDLPKFKLELSKSFSLPLSKLNGMFSIGMSAGDVYIALEISTLAKKPIDDVIAVYSKSKSKGWGAMAKELGIKPGSAEFHKLKGKCKDKSAKKAGSGSSSKGNGNGNGNGKGKKK
jgi:hypothetical protein